LTVMALCNTVIPIKRLYLCPCCTNTPQHVLVHLPYFAYFLKLSRRMRMLWLMQPLICMLCLSAKMEIMLVGFCTFHHGLLACNCLFLVLLLLQITNKLCI
jgi:hypothetical protein